MSIFASIASAIFGSKTASAAQAAGSPAAAAPAAGKPTPMSKSDVEAMIEKLADESDEDFNWRQSIVDLMKLLKLDSGLAARKELAKELGYSGDTNDSAKMNVWLHQQVMHKLAENGGKVPADLVH